MSSIEDSLKTVRGLGIHNTKLQSSHSNVWPSKLQLMPWQMNKIEALNGFNFTPFITTFFTLSLMDNFVGLLSTVSCTRNS